MEEKYKYLKSKSLPELIEIIDNFNDKDETVEALDILSDLDSEKTLEKGINFLWNNDGDEYFQAMIIDIIDDIDFDRVLDCLKNRKDDIQAYLLGELMQEMRRHSSDKNIVEYVKMINKKYILLERDEKKRIAEQYNRFIDRFETCINDLE